MLRSVLVLTLWAHKELMEQKSGDVIGFKIITLNVILSRQHGCLWMRYEGACSKISIPHKF